MTFPRLLLIAIACFVFVDMKFGDGRTIDALEYQVASLGSWLHGISYKIARH